ncbi:MAG: hypothetical protein AAGC43_12100 [Bacteroidota bacterium]
MKRKILLGLLLSICFLPNVQSQNENPEDDADLFNFWVGKWEATWDEGNGKLGKGFNSISRDLNGRILRENFEIVEGQSKGFKGTSISVHQPQFKRWKQAWADSQGGYFDFIAEYDKSNEHKIFKTKIHEKDGKKYIYRMVFKEIQTNTFIWDWEFSSDGGTTWKLQWRINYKRVGSS